jgi:hypothetical protein
MTKLLTFWLLTLEYCLPDAVYGFATGGFVIAITRQVAPSPSLGND